MTEFHRNRSRKGGHDNWCKRCKKAAKRLRTAPIRKQRWLRSQIKAGMKLTFSGYDPKLRKDTKPARVMNNPRKPVSNIKYPELYDVDWLTQKYRAELKSPGEIADELGCSLETVSVALTRFDIPRIPPVLRNAMRNRRDQRRREEYHARKTDLVLENLHVITDDCWEDDEVPVEPGRQVKIEQERNVKMVVE